MGTCLWWVDIKWSPRPQNSQDHQKTLGGSLAVVRLLVPTCHNTILASKARGKPVPPVQAPAAGLNCDETLVSLHLPPRSLSGGNYSSCSCCLCSSLARHSGANPIPTNHSQCARVWVVLGVGVCSAACLAINWGLGSSHIQVLSC